MTDIGLPLTIRSEDDIDYTVDVYQMDFESLSDLWEKFSKHRVLLADHAYENPQEFYSMILARNTVVLRVSNVGIIYATDLIPGYYATAHYFFWDRVTDGRHKVILHTLKWGMESFNLHRVNIEIPRHAYAALHRVHKIGFRLEGIERESVLHKGKWHDMFKFGILADELTPRALASGHLERIGDERGWFGLLKKDQDLMNFIAEVAT